MCNSSLILTSGSLLSCSGDLQHGLWAMHSGSWESKYFCVSEEGFLFTFLSAPPNSAWNPRKIQAESLFWSSYRNQGTTWKNKVAIVTNRNGSRTLFYWESTYFSAALLRQLCCHLARFRNVEGFFPVSSWTILTWDRTIIAGQSIKAQKIIK
jgi:hypothetical protein